MGNPATEGQALVQAIVKEDVRLWLDALAEKEGLTRSDLVRRALYTWYEKERAAGPRAFDTALEEQRQKNRRRERARVKERRRAKAAA